MLTKQSLVSVCWNVAVLWVDDDLNAQLNDELVDENVYRFPTSPSLSHATPTPSLDVSVPRVFNSDFPMGGDIFRHVPPQWGGTMGGDKGPMGGDLCVIRDNIIRSLYKPQIHLLNHLLLLK